ncbi:hypothetical protein ANN_07194 [Periplaneta americana]|uniref:Uncharacterized protein n=1 Tax=Periplaneta americana TaxID=6978 RepID=A0ABQ8TFP3_PERAM|nr:hypothetical protein ANN_07194 [Periplaneta americana]
MDASSVRRWVKYFEDGNTSIQDVPRSGRPLTASTERNKERVDEFWDAFCPNLAPSDYHLFGCLKEQLRGQRYETLEDIRKAVRQCLREDETDFYSKGIFKLTERREGYVERNGNYVESDRKLFRCQPISCSRPCLLQLGVSALEGVPIHENGGGGSPCLAGSIHKRTAPRFTQPPIKLSTGSFPGIKGGQNVVPTTPPHSSAEVMGLYLHAPEVPSWHVTGIPLPFVLPFIK